MRTVVAVLALVACVHAGLWALLRTKETAPNFNGQLASVSYSPFADSSHPDTGARPTAEQIRADLKAIAPYTRAIRTYSATGGAELVPPIAAEFGLKVTVGAWIDKDKDRNEREIRSALDLARHNSNVNAIVVGNETTLRAEMGVDDLIKLIQQVKRQSPVPVTTGEIWTVWIDHPELASAVDFIAAHILPYWEGFDASHAVDHTIEFYDKLRQMHPGKRIVIAEFGWPSAGYNFHQAEPGRFEQAMVIRDFVNRAQAYGIDYNVVEAIDQPWKTMEGGVGPYWGLFDASRQAKFPWTGPITDPDYVKQAGLAVLLGVLLSLPILALSGVTVTQAALLAVSANIVGAWFTAIVAFWKGHYFVPGAAFALGLGIILLIPLVAIAMARLEEIAAIAFGRGTRRLVISPPLAPEGYAPKVSIHIPACCESPEMLVATLDAVAKLEYPNFECVIVINNTPDPALWQPVEAHCRALGERFKFGRVDKLAGYKAGALRIALERTAPDAEIIGSIDADYVVSPDWLRDMVPLFSDPRVGLVQSPQDHRDGDRSLMHAAMNAEYAGFFDIGMVQRNEVNAIIVHGTMCLIRRAALEAVGNWPTDTIVEDSDLGLHLLESGWTAHYTNRRYGHGLLPDTFEAYKKQRQRWAFGGFQLVQKHWRHLLPGAAGLSRDQKREYAIGWLNWLGAETVGVVVALLNIVWVPVVAFANIAVPDRILTIPIVAASAVAVLHFISLYRLRVRATPLQMAGAVCAAMSVQWTVARAVSMGIVQEHIPFLRTAKGGVGRKGPDFAAFWEAIIAGLLLAGSATLVITNYKQVREINIFAFVLVVQSVPFLSAVTLALIEGTRFNSFAFWRGLEAKIGELLPQRRAIGQGVISQVIASQVIASQVINAEPPKVPADNRIEAAQ
ncbi:MAG: glycosyltransferase [Xanthobacteraceae bacterium]|jgi:exo-beta-1,3-glucanase (GH17 family)/cellulose synthase/poly-beta-1,6-N-acetylglucosamine synthase-like glycosyltransferase